MWFGRKLKPSKVVGIVRNDCGCYRNAVGMLILKWVLGGGGMVGERIGDSVRESLEIIVWKSKHYVCKFK